MIIIFAFLFTGSLTKCEIVGVKYLAECVAVFLKFRFYESTVFSISAASLFLNVDT